MPRTPTTDDKIEAAVRRFVEELRGLVHEAALEAIDEVLRGEGLDAWKKGQGVRKSADSPRGRKAPATPRARGTSKARTARPASRSASVASSGKRSADDIAAAEGAILAYVRKHPGAKGEDIREAVGESRASFRLPLNKLLEAGKLRKKGEKRATRYWAAS